MLGDCQSHEECSFNDYGKGYQISKATDKFLQKQLHIMPWMVNSPRFSDILYVSQINEDALRPVWHFRF